MKRAAACTKGRKKSSGVSARGRCSLKAVSMVLEMRTSKEERRVPQENMLIAIPSEKLEIFATIHSTLFDSKVALHGLCTSPEIFDA